MSASAYILIDVPPREDVKEIVATIRKFECVKKANAVAGPHDIIVEIEAGDFNSLAHKVIDEIRSVHGISDTVTLYVIQ